MVANMQLRITIREEESPVTIQNAVQLNEVLRFCI